MEESEYNDDIRATFPNNRLGGEGLEGQPRSLDMLRGGSWGELEGAASWGRTGGEAPPAGASDTPCGAVMEAQCTDHGETGIPALNDRLRKNRELDRIL